MKRTRHYEKVTDESLKVSAKFFTKCFFLTSDFFWLQQKILILRVIDLHSILSAFKYPKNLRKDALQRHLLCLLKGKDISEAQKLDIRKLIEKSYDKL